MKTTSHKKIVLLLSFLLPCGVMAGVFALCGLAPFGDRTLGVMDMSHQYLAFLYSLRDVLSGRAGLFYLPSMNLGGNMAGLFAYYLTSPLNLLTCLFPRERMYDAVSLLYLLRVGLCGLTMGLYAGSRHGWSFRCLVPAMAYAFMAYMAAYSFNYLWQDSVALLPVIALGIARLRAEGRPFLYILSLAGALYLNFYIGYILCIFSVLFFLLELLSAPAEGGPAPGRAVLTFALSSLAAGALAAVVLLPAFLSLRSGKADFDLSVLTLEPKFPLPGLLAKLFPGAFGYDEIMPAGLPQVFCGTATSVLTVLYFLNGAVPRRRRLLAGGLMALVALSFWITALDLVWHCLNTPNWYNYRYSFVLSFLMAAAADRELTRLRTGTRPWHLAAALGVVGLGAVLAFAGRTWDFAGWSSGLAGLGMALLVCALLWALRRPGTAGKRLSAVLAALLLLAHTGELAANGRLTLDAVTAQAADRTAYADYAAAKSAAFALADPGDAFRRVESPTAFALDRCEPMLFGYDGLSHYGSTTAGKNLDFLDRLGLDRYTDLWVTYGPGVTAAADTLLGVRYLVSETMTKPYAPAAEAEGYTVWENENALPIGWTADAALAAPIAAEDSFAYLNALYAAAAPEVAGPVFRPAEAAVTALENFTADGGDYTRVEEVPAVIAYTVAVPADGALYGEFGIPDFPGVMVFADGTMRAWYATAQTNGTVYLGDYQAGDTVEVRLQASADIAVTYAAFAVEDTDALARYSAALRTGGCELTKLSSSRYEGSFTAGEGDSLLVLTLPEDASWRVLLDGRAVTPAQAQDCLMALPVTDGTHTLSLRYVPAGLRLGGAVSLLALAALLCVWRSAKKKRSR